MDQPRLLRLPQIILAKGPEERRIGLLQDHRQAWQIRSKGLQEPLDQSQTRQRQQHKKKPATSLAQIYDSMIYYIFLRTQVAISCEGSPLASNPLSLSWASPPSGLRIMNAQEFQPIRYRRSRRHSICLTPRRLVLWALQVATNIFRIVGFSGLSGPGVTQTAPLPDDSRQIRRRRHFPLILRILRPDDQPSVEQGHQRRHEKDLPPLWLTKNRLHLA